MFEQTLLMTVLDYDYYIADGVNGSLDVELHCIGARGSGSWKTPDGRDINVESGLTVENSTDGQSEILTSNGTFVGEEGYYQCVALNENRTTKITHVGLFYAEEGIIMITAACIVYVVYSCSVTVLHYELTILLLQVIIVHQ